MAISISSGSRPNPSLASLNFDSMVETGAKGMKIVDDAKKEKRAFDLQASEKLRDDFQKSKIIHGQILAATSQNENIVAQLQAGVDNGSNDATTKAYKRFIDGNYTQSDLAVVNAYITAANAQQEEMKVAQERENKIKLQNQKLEAQNINQQSSKLLQQIAIEAGETPTVETVSKAHYEILPTIQDTLVADSLMAKVAEYKNTIIAHGNTTAGISDYTFEHAKLSDAATFLEDGKIGEAMRVLNTLGLPTTIKEQIGERLMTVAELKERYGNQVIEDEGDDVPVTVEPVASPKQLYSTEKEWKKAKPKKKDYVHSLLGTAFGPAKIEAEAAFQAALAKWEANKPGESSIAELEADVFNDE